MIYYLSYIFTFCSIFRLFCFFYIFFFLIFYKY